MVDNLSKEKRSKVMRSIRSKDTKPELLVRKILTTMGYRYRLHRKDIPGRPDIAFIRRKKAIFVNGCFWHAHDNCPIAHIPDSKFWREKLAANKMRDQKNLASLKSNGWSTLLIWECSLKHPKSLKNKLSRFIGATKLD